MIDKYVNWIYCKYFKERFVTKQILKVHNSVQSPDSSLKSILRSKLHYPVQSSVQSPVHNFMYTGHKHRFVAGNVDFKWKSYLGFHKMNVFFFW